MPALDVFVLTSVRRSEGIPTVVVEAMACGLPIVTTRVGGVAEVVDDGVTGVIVPAGDDVAIVEAVGRLLRKGGLRQEMGQLGRTRCESDFGLKGCADAHLDAYRRAMRRYGLEN